MMATMERKSEKQNGKIVRLDPRRVKLFADQPRKRFSGIDKLAASIRKIGQVTPIVVTASVDPAYDAELVDGERRLQACRKAGIGINAIFERELSRSERFAKSVAANFCRQPHDCLEVAEAVHQMHKNNLKVEEIAQIFGKSICWTKQHLMILKLHPEVQKMLIRKEGETRKEIKAGGRLSFQMALMLVPLPPEHQVKAAKHITKRKLNSAAARRYVFQQGRKAGRQVGRMISPLAHFERMKGLITKLRHLIG
jgi:ParB/RepB/Spo0J family partition protein